jgi:hypothetical protein
MKKPYVKLYREVDGLKIYIVDGKYIRDKWNDQFTDFAIHQRFGFIPSNEAWIDREVGGGKEYKYFVDNILKERECVKEGDTIWQAGEKGDIVEKKARRFEIKKPIKKKKVYEYANISVFVVDGDAVRSRYDVDFTQGGHDLVYDWIKPKKGKGEIYLDDYYSGPDLEDIALHEMHERNRMALGQDYGHGNRVTGAHASASFEEKLARRNPALLKSLIEKEREVARIIYEEGTGDKARKHIDELNKTWNCAIKFDICKKYKAPKVKKTTRHSIIQGISKLR